MTCSHCGATVPRDALACPDCGSDSETGWANDEVIDEALYGDFDEEDYREVVAGLPGGEADAAAARRRFVIGLVALVTATFFVLVYVL